MGNFNSTALHRVYFFWLFKSKVTIEAGKKGRGEGRGGEGWEEINIRRIRNYISQLLGENLAKS